MLRACTGMQAQSRPSMMPPESACERDFPLMDKKEKELLVRQSIEGMQLLVSLSAHFGRA